MRYVLPTIASPLWLLAFSAAVVFADEPPAADSPADAAGIEWFENHIRPVLVDECFACHSQAADPIEGGLELDTSAGLLAGGAAGSIINTEKVEASLLLRALRHEEGVESMPPGKKLDEETINAFEKWIRLGAPDPRDRSQVTSRQRQRDKQLDHWAFQSPQASDPPPVSQTDWPRGPIDSFILARLEAEALQPVADANRATLIRRLCFDLIGLPPTTEEVRQFVEDPSADAVAKLVDRLLASPRFGEQWARHWLDVVRYAESSGKEFNFTYPHAWPYRDYVIAALNNDKPFNRFVCEQIAGDLMPPAPDETPAERESRLIATSVLSFGPKRHNSSGTAFRMEIVDDQIDVTSRAILGLTVGCAKCHDHKFDPIPTKDYYSLAGIFLSTEPLYGTIKQKYSNTPTDLLPIGPNGQAQHDALQSHLKLVADAEKPLNDKKTELTAAEAAKKAADEKKAAADKTIATNKDSGKAVGPALKKEFDEANAAAQAAAAKVAKLKAELAPLQAALDDLKKKRPPTPDYAMSARDRAAPADTTIAIRGDLGSPGEVAPRGFLTALKVEGAPAINPAQSGRLELANWMTSENNPLIARVFVNRVWHHLFGRGIVSTVDNFGLLGSKPTHPELLDTLAVKFMQEGWSMKRLIRTIVMSRTYQLSCDANEPNMQIDPDNKLLWRSSIRRLSVEQLRDSLLAVSGQLQIEPPHGSPVTALGDQMVRGVPTEKLQPPSNLRSVYLPVVRDYAPDMFDRFDFPSSALVSGRRSVTNTPSQALFLRNSKFIAEQASHAAQRLLAELPASEAVDTEAIDTEAVDTEGITAVDATRVDLAIRWSLGRGATAFERAAALKLIEPVRTADIELKEREVAAWATVFRALFATAEFRYLTDIQSP